MKVFLDTNIFLDILLERKEFYTCSRKVREAVIHWSLQGYIWGHTIDNLAYILQRCKIKGKHVQQILKDIVEDFSVSTIDTKVIQQALAMSHKDIEDQISYQSALSSKATSIITRNKKDFPPSKDIHILTPEEYIIKFPEFF
jgi:predicted nucleic acid-binding protein